VFVAYIGPDSSLNTYFDWMAQNFMFWSGGFKFKIYFFSTSFQNVKVVFWIAPSIRHSWENCYYKILDITQDCSVEFTVPYMEQAVKTTTGGTPTFSLYMEVLSFTEPIPSLALPVYMNVYKAAASDMQLDAHMEVKFFPTHNPKADFAADFDCFQSSMTGYRIDGFVMGENITTIRELVHKLWPYSSDYTGHPIYQATGASDGSYAGIEMFGLNYVFRRGSVVTSVLTPVMGSGYLNNINLQVTGGAQTFMGTYFNSQTNPLLGMEVPYYSGFLFEYTSDNDTKQVQTAAIGPGFLFKGAGDDFSFHFMRAPPAGHFVNNTGATNLTGYGALRTWIHSLGPS